MNYFAECTTLDEAKALFRKLSLKLHPDTSGYNSQADFVQMFKEFENFRPSVKREGDEFFNASKFYDLIKNFDHLQNVTISFVGSFIWLEDSKGHEGATKAQKDLIKDINLIGFNPPRFAFKRLKWYFSPEGYKQKFKSKKTFEELKDTWGCKTYKTKEKQALAY